MSTLRPEEIQRRTFAAGYGDRSPSNPQGVHEDDTTVLAKANGKFDFGDWVKVADLQQGYLSVKKPTSDGDKEWCGVIQHHVEEGDWVLVKTAGVCIAKVDSGADAESGDALGTTENDVAATDLSGDGAQCARFLKRFGGDDAFAWVEIGGGGGSPLSVNHHEESKNSEVIDTTDAATIFMGKPLILKAPLWHVWKVKNINFTGDLDPRLMTCIGGATLHGDLPWEGWAWGGVIGSVGDMGFGEFGGNSDGGQQGVLGAETKGPSSDHEQNQNRINVRSWAGFNAHDRYGMAAHVVAPIRFTYCATENKPQWWVPKGCDCVVSAGTPPPVVTPGPPPCGPDLLWWSGTMKRDPVFNPAGATHTDWQQQWTPQLACERDCDSALIADLPPVSIPDCSILDTNGRDALQSNRKDVCGGYESIVPFGYVPCHGRQSVVQGLASHASHIAAIWLSFWRMSDVVSKILGCHDAALLAFKAFFGTKTNGVGAQPPYTTCCDTQWHPPILTVGPDLCAPCQQSEPTCPTPGPATP